MLTHFGNLLFIGTLAAQINVQLLFHVFRHLPVHRTIRRIDHPVCKGYEEIDIAHHLLTTHHRHGIIAVMDRGGILRCDTSKGYRRDSPVRKGRGVRGINILANRNTKALL